MLEEDAKNVLAFISSNGLVANAAKTALIFMNVSSKLNKNEAQEPISIKIGNMEVFEESNTKLLGVTLDADQKWTTHICKLISSLNSRLFLIKRLNNVVSKDRLKKVADSLYMSKIRYGIQLLGCVRTKKEDSANKLLGSIQVAQNKLARFLNVSSLLNKISTEDIFKKIGILSDNQINAQTKLL